ncbi:flagellin [Planomicrobium okeanokoites]|uniref:flagellin N-terminal helical domain-containing protein n=1 Tax=Planomicrobium okeanokoites TaxID=244 RepID=UPI0030F6EA3D
MIINHNITALNTHRQLGSANNAQANSMEKLSSGLRINKASDDAAGLSISEKMRGQIRGLEQASANAQDGISLMQTAEGALNETHDILQRMRELAVQSANDTNTDTDRKELQKEVTELASEITRIGNNTEFNTKTLLDGDFTATFHIGANEGQNLSLSVSDMRSEALQVGVSYTAAQTDLADDTTSTLTLADGSVATWQAEVAFDDNGTAGDTTDDTAASVAGYFVTTAGSAAYTAGDLFLESETAVRVGEGVKGIDISSQTTADAAITTINNAIESVSSERSKLGANQNRLDHTINNLGTSAENLTAAESRIRDVDYAEAA